MKVKVVLLFVIGMMLLVSCTAQNENKEDEAGVRNMEDSYNTSSTIGGGKGTPSEQNGFRN